MEAKRLNWTSADFFKNSEMATLISKLLSVGNDANLFQLEILNKQYHWGGVLSVQLKEFRFALSNNQFEIIVSIFSIFTNSAHISWESFALFSTDNHFEIIA